MFSEEILEKILSDKEVAKVPLCYKYVMITAIERILDQEEKENATLPYISELP